MLEKLKAKLKEIRAKFGLKHYLTLPAVIVLFALLIFPLLYAVFNISLYDFTGATKTFVGLGNFKSVVNSDTFIYSFKLSLYYTALSVGGSFLLGLGIALTLNRNFRGKSFFQSIYIIPMAMAPAVIAYGFKFMLDPNIGVINSILNQIGLPTIEFLSTPIVALHTLILIDIWQWTPFVILVLVAALESLPDEPFEAARIAGASKWQTFRHISFPMIKPAIFIVVLIRMMDALKNIDKILILTGGGPGRSTETLAALGHKTSFTFFRFGKGTAIGLILLFVIIVLCWIFVKVATRGGRGWGVV